MKICDLGSAPFGASWGENEQILLGTQQGVVRVDARGGTPELLFPSSESYPTGFNPQSLPGGEWVLYMVPATRDELPDEWRIIVRSRTSGERKVVVATVPLCRLFCCLGHLVYAAATRCLRCPSTRSRDACKAQQCRSSTASPMWRVLRCSLPCRRPARSCTFPASAGDVGTTRLVQLTRSGVPSPLMDVPGVAWFPRYSPDGIAHRVHHRAWSPI